MFSRCEGILLRKTPYGDNDLVLSFLTDRGTHSFFARAARRSRRRFAGQLDYFRRLSLVCSKKGEGDFLSLDACDLLEPWQELWQDADKYPVACAWIDLARKLLPAGKGGDLYPFIRDSLRYLASRPLAADLSLRFELRLSMKLGYGPNFEAGHSYRISQECIRWLAFYQERGSAPFLLSPEQAGAIRALLDRHWQEVI